MHNRQRGFVSFGTLVALSVGAVLAAVALCFVIVQNNRQYVLSDSHEVAGRLVESPKTAVVFGSGLRGDDGTPGRVLAARLDAAIDLFTAGAVERIIVSGFADNYYNEPTAMQQYLVARAVPHNAILLDEAGDNSFATCQNTRQQFGVTNAVLVTQPSHLARTIYLCRSHGIEAYGFAATTTGSFGAQIFQQVREAGSNVRAVLEVNVEARL